MLAHLKIRVQKVILDLTTGDIGTNFYPGLELGLRKPMLGGGRIPNARTWMQTFIAAVFLFSFFIYICICGAWQNTKYLDIDAKFCGVVFLFSFVFIFVFAVLGRIPNTRTWMQNFVLR